MNILYKYCDQLGVIKIIGSLELKLPYISEVNDPYECLPIFYCPDDKSAMEAKYLRAFNYRLPDGWKQTLYEQIKTGDFQERLKESRREVYKDFNQRKGCLLSVSKTAKESVMWAHYADNHKGAVIGIDFDNVYPDTNGPSNLVMHSVSYSKDRPKINVLEESEEKVLNKSIETTVRTKSISCKYEEEFRSIFFVDYLERLRQQGLAHLRDFKGKNTWFLRLNPESIREIIFGLYTDEGLKSAIRKLTERAELKHVILYQAEESETYTLNLIPQ